MDLADLQNSLGSHGLLVQGSLMHDGETVVLAGNAGSDLWSVFTASAEYRDQRPDPLDRWTRRIGLLIARETGTRAIFPFDGPPYPPFLDWAARAGVAFPSPVSMYVHPVYGLWHAFRFALVLDQPVDPVSTKPAESPCITCREQPCLAACPADAFDGSGYRVGECLDYLNRETTSDCRTGGCAARRACPVGMEFTYQPLHAQFHMEAFIAAHASGSTVDGD